MEPDSKHPDRSLPRFPVLVVPLVLLLSMAAPLGVLALRSTPFPSTEPVAAPAPSRSPSPSSPSTSPASPATSTGPTPTTGPPTSTAPPPVTGPSGPPGSTTTSAFSLVTGDCLPIKPPESASVTVVVLPCTQPHRAEVFAVFALPGPPGVGFPGEQVATTQAAAGCERRFADYVGIAYGASSFDYFFYKPDVGSWSQLLDRTVTCLLTSTEPRDSSAKDSQA